MMNQLQLALRALDFRQVHKDPWLSTFPVEFECNSTSSNQCSSSLLRSLFRLSSIKLVSLEDLAAKQTHLRRSVVQNSESQLKNYLTCDFFQSLDALSRHKNTKSNWRLKFLAHIRSAKVLILILAICIVFIASPLQIASYLLHRRDKLLKNTDPVQVRPGAEVHYDTSGNLCAKKEDIVYTNYRTRLELERAHSAVKDYGVVAALPGASMLSHSIISVGPYMFCLCSVIILYVSPIRVDQLAFLYDPLGERKRIKNELNNILQDLIITTTKLYLRRQSMGIDEQLRFSRHDDSWIRNETLHPRPTLSTDLFNFRDVLNFIKLIDYVHSYSLARPICVEPLWHKYFDAFATILTSNLTKSICVVTYVASSYLMVHEIYLRTSERVAITRCQMNWSANYTIVSQLLHTDSIKSANTLKAYEDYVKLTISGNNTLTDFFGLMIFVEAKEYFNKGTSIFALLVLTNVGLLCGCSTLQSLVLMLGVSHKLMWLEQIIGQVQACIRLAHSFNYDRANIHLLLATAASLMNYRLYHHEFEQFQKLIQFLMVQMTLFCGISLISCHLVITSSMLTVKIHIINAAVSLAIAMNIYLGLGTYISFRILKLMKSIMSLIALFPKTTTKNRAGNPMDITIYLWRKQLISDDEVYRLFAPNLFGWYISYDKLVSIDIYMFAVFLFVWT